MIIKSWCKLVYGRFGYIKKTSMKISHINEICCDICDALFDESNFKTKRNEPRFNMQLCGKCKKKKNGEKFGKIGAKVLSSFPKELKKKYASDAGKISQLKSPNNAGHFSTERWNKMDKDEQLRRVKKANKGLYDKLNANEELKREHYLKIFKNSKIGFTSKGHNELHDFLKELGFEQHIQISSMEVDECNENLKIVIEFNGDMYHCNPRKWKPDDYNKVIKMHAKEKWQKDRNRYYKLKNLGYSTFVVWEDDWALKRDEIKSKIIKYVNNKINENCKNRTDK